MHHMSTRVLVVDDVVLFRRVVSEALAAIPGIEVVGSASNGKLALSRIASLAPDVMTLDIEMPEMNGIEVLEAIQAAGSKLGIIVLSSQTRKGSALTVRALELGAFDFVTKPEGGTPEGNLALLRQQMIPILRAYERRKEIRDILAGTPERSPVMDSGKPTDPAKRMGASKATEAAHMASVEKPLDPPFGRKRRAASPIVLIGVSTGGPSALADILPALPADLSAPVFIAQHMPPLFTEALAASLDTKCKLKVREASDGEVAQAGCAYIAPGGRQMKLSPGNSGEIQIQITEDAPENNYRPSVDYLFRSAALHFPGRSIAVILTGMGSDGSLGLKMLKRGGCFSIAQDEASCVVFGMPREAIATGLVDQVCPLHQISAAIQRGIEGGIV
jgi:two-component system, chemotaxis family, protein-glutamate methylesterase/glutaminase